MITEKDLNEAIAECQGKRNPDAQTCRNLAAFLTIKRELYGEPPSPEYSFASEPAETVTLDSGTEFSEAVKKADPAHVWKVLDELMGILQMTSPRLYRNVLNRLGE